MNRKASTLFLLLTSILLTGILVQFVLAQDYDNYETITLDSNNQSKGLTMSLNINDTLFYDFKATSKITFWIEDPNGSPIETPFNYIKPNFGNGLLFQASSSGDYSLHFSLPDETAGSTTVEIAYSISRYSQPMSNEQANYLAIGLIIAVSVFLIVVVMKLRK